jgi:gliding motility-associated-like protein
VSNMVTATIPVGVQPAGIALSPDGNTVYVTNFSDNTVSVINAKTNKVIATIPVGNGPWGMAVSPDDSHVYVTNNEANTVSVITTATNTVSATIPVGSVPQGICINPGGSFIYVANANSSVSVINTQTNQVVATISLSLNPTSLCISPDGSRLYVLDGLSAVGASTGDISVINTATNTVLSTITVAKLSTGIAITPDGNTIYVANYLQNAVSEINISNNSITTSFPVGSDPVGIAVSPDGSLVYVTNEGSGTVSVISTGFDRVISTIPVGSAPLSYGNFFTGGSVCSGAPVKFTITVNPASIATPAITEGSVTGNISACAGTASASPQIEQFTVSGTNLTANITATASTGFEVSLSASSGYGTSVTLTQTGSTVSNAVVYVRSAATATPGKVTGTVLLSSTGAASRPVAIAATINALPTVNDAGNQAVTNGTTTTAIDFNGTGNVFTWVNDTPGIGLPASGTGDIPPFSATNAGSSPVTATITVTPAPNLSGFAYITNNNANTVSVINIGTNKVVATITVGTNPSGVAISPDGTRVYIVNSNSSTVSVINTASNTVIATIPIGEYSFGAALSPDGSHLYVANLGSGTVSVINTATNTVSATITGVPGPFCVAVSPDGSELFVTENGSSGAVSVINTANNSIKATIPVGSYPIGVAVSPDGKLVYVANESSDNVSVINTATNSVVSTIPVGASPYGIALSPDGNTLYVANTGSGSVSVINTAADAVTATITVQQVPSGISVSPDGSLVYVANAASGTVSVINTATNAVTATITVGQGPYSLGNFISGGAGCSGIPVKFTITVNPSNHSAISAEGELPPLVTTYGTPSSATILQVSGTSLTAGILVTPPEGFELSTDGVTFTPTITAGAGGDISATQIYIRLAATTPVGEYSGPIILTSGSVTPDTVLMPVSTVNPAPLTIIADNKSKIYGAENPVLTASYDGFVNEETRAVLTLLPVLSTTAVTLSPVGEYLISVSGAQASNYSISYQDGVLSVAPPEQDIFIPNTFTPNGDGVNDTWNIKYLNAYSNCSVNIFTRWGKNVFSSVGYGTPWDGTYSGKPLPMGTYYYVINLKNGGSPLAGFVLIVR